MEEKGIKKKGRRSKRDNAHFLLRVRKREKRWDCCLFFLLLNYYQERDFKGGMREFAFGNSIEDMIMNGQLESHRSDIVRMDGLDLRRKSSRKTYLARFCCGEIPNWLSHANTHFWRCSVSFLHTRTLSHLNFTLFSRSSMVPSSASSEFQIFEDGWFFLKIWIKWSMFRHLVGTVLVEPNSASSATCYITRTKKLVSQ